MFKKFFILFLSIILILSFSVSAFALSYDESTLSWSIPQSGDRADYVLVKDSGYNYIRTSFHDAYLIRSFYPLNDTYLYYVFSCPYECSISTSSLHTQVKIGVDGEYTYERQTIPANTRVDLFVHCEAWGDTNAVTVFYPNSSISNDHVSLVSVSTSDLSDPLLGMSITGSLPVGYALYVRNANSPIELRTTSSKRLSSALAPTYRLSFDTNFSVFSEYKFTGTNKNLFGNSTDWHATCLYSSANDVFLINPPLNLESTSNGNYRGSVQNSIIYSVPYNPNLSIVRIPLHTSIGGNWNEIPTVDVLYTSDSAIEVGLPDEQGMIEYYTSDEEGNTTSVPAITMPNGLNNGSLGIDDESLVAITQDLNGVLGSASKHINNLVENGSDFVRSSSSMFTWLPVEVQGVLISALIIVITIGVLKVFL